MINLVKTILRAAVDLFDSTNKVVDFCGNLGVLGAWLLGGYVVLNPDVLAEYLKSIQQDVDVIAESIPLWPTIASFDVSFDPPRSASVSLVVENPKNSLLHEFEGHLALSFSGRREVLRLGGAGVIPPNENVELAHNFIREPWLPELVQTSTANATLCLSGVLEGTEDKFYEYRVYELALTSEKTSLINREFAFEDRGLCN